MHDALNLYDLDSPLVSTFASNFHLKCEFFFFFFVEKVCIEYYSRVQSSLPLPLSWFVSTQRKPEEESPVKDTDAKQAKQETTVNGSSDSSASNGNGVQEGKSQEASDRLLSYVPIHYRTAL